MNFLWLSSRRRVAVAVGLLAAAAAVTAWSVASTTGAQAANSPLLPPTPAADGANVKGAQQFVLAHIGAPKFVAPGPAYNINKVKKPVWLFEAVANDPPVPQVADGFVAAAKAAGVPYHVCLANGTPEGNALCLQQATAAHAGSAVMWSVPLSEVVHPLAQARAAGLKVVSGNDSLHIGAKINPAVDGEVSHDYYQAGVENGAYAVALDGGHVDAMCINIPDFYTGTAVCSGFTYEVHKFCPSCKVKTVNVPGATALTQAPAVVNAAILGDHNLDFIATSYDYIDPAIDTELKLLGKKPSQVAVAGENGSIAPLQAIKTGNYDVSNAGQDPYWWGWAFFDTAARVQVGALGKASIVTTPNELFTTQTLARYTGPLSYGAADQVYGLGSGSLYRNGYMSLWHG
jgi:ABC-type sugar transport system substrate-binding protein